MDNEKPKRARNFRNYKVWQDALAYATKVYKVTATLPYFEKKGLCDQLQRAVVSISSNIAEGWLNHRMSILLVFSIQSLGLHLRSRHNLR